MVDPRLLEVMWCPRCHGDLVEGDAELLVCGSCGSKYPVVDGIPDMVIGEEE